MNIQALGSSGCGGGKRFCAGVKGNRIAWDAGGLGDALPVGSLVVGWKNG